MKKILISFLSVAVFYLFVGCHSYKLITTHEYSRLEEKDRPKDIRIMTKDYQMFDFSDSKLYILNDSLYGKSILLIDNREELVERKIALSDILDIEVKGFDLFKTILLLLGIYLGVGLIVGIIIGVRNA